MNYKIIAKYIKNIDFDINEPNTFLSLTKDISNYKFKIDIKSNPFKDNLIEVQTTLALVPKDDVYKNLNATVTFSTLVELDKKMREKKELEKIILIEVPKEIYPDLRKIFILVFESSGFREIKIDENIDFKKLYLSRKN